ncbi:MAG TPA: PIG-L family deacetylase [Verrucomicrobiota bacterium]|nr:PIG-L family deacetylase [Verrucomicrobiota bacterium]HNT14268.1 PIG-L family deacetylase [Verrucomicrobiota bacterium]
MSICRTALSLLAHPDDAEFLCAGTLALLHEQGWNIHIATMTPGDCGSATLAPAEISAVRRAEGAQAAALIAATFHCLELGDGNIWHDRDTLRRVVGLLREVRPTLLLTHSPSCYLFDHEATSLLARQGAFWSSVPNYQAPGNALPLATIPHLYYADPMEGKDILGVPVLPTGVVDVTSQMATKRAMLRCHASQREWLHRQHGLDSYVQYMETMAQLRGQLVGCNFGEGFRQHLGHAYPQNNLLASELGACFHPCPTNSTSSPTPGRAGLGPEATDGRGEPPVAFRPQTTPEP